MKLLEKAGLGIAALAVLALQPNVANAEAETATYQMTVIEDQAYGRSIVSGKYGLAIERLSNTKKRYTKAFAAQNNLCVAYTKSGDLAQAQIACDTAIELIKSSAIYKRSERFFSEDARSRLQTDLAVALSNRGVLRVLMGEDSLAIRDFQAADQLGTTLEAPVRNLAKAMP